jgi:hypothetical protein
MTTTPTVTRDAANISTQAASRQRPRPTGRLRLRPRP